MRLVPYASASLLAATAIAALLVAHGCFSPDMPDCTFRCDPASVKNEGHCPESYTCQPDGYCHRNGTSTTCPYSLPSDAAVAGDLAVTGDLAVGDLVMSGGDLAGSADLGHSCSDNQKNGDETDVDCGGSCVPCAEGKGCTVGKDCASMSCIPVDGGMAKCAPAPGDLSIRD